MRALQTTTGLYDGSTLYRTPDRIIEDRDGTDTRPSPLHPYRMRKTACGTDSRSAPRSSSWAMRCGAASTPWRSGAPPAVAAAYEMSFRRRRLIPKLRRLAPVAQNHGPRAYSPGSGTAGRRGSRPPGGIAPNLTRYHFPASPHGVARVMAKPSCNGLLRLPAMLRRQTCRGNAIGIRTADHPPGVRDARRCSHHRGIPAPGTAFNDIKLYYYLIYYQCFLTPFIRFCRVHLAAFRKR
jgi:hypothetical protein